MFVPLTSAAAPATGSEVLASRTVPEISPAVDCMQNPEKAIVININNFIIIFYCFDGAKVERRYYQTATISLSYPDSCNGEVSGYISGWAKRANSFPFDKDRRNDCLESDTGKETAFSGEVAFSPILLRIQNFHVILPPD
jgi:hypothetical protein